jgi:hypothetical protein
LDNLVEVLPVGDWGRFVQGWQYRHFPLLRGVRVMGRIGVSNQGIGDAGRVEGLPVQERMILRQREGRVEERQIAPEREVRPSIVVRHAFEGARCPNYGR